MIALAVSLAALQVAAQDSIDNLSLKETIDMALEKNMEIVNADLERQKAAYKLKESRSQFYPQIEGYSLLNYYYAIPKMVIPGEIFGQTGPIPVEIGTKYDWSSGFRASQLLYNQSYLTSLKVAKIMAAMDELSLIQQKEEMIYQVSQVYYLCQSTRNQITQLQISWQNMERLGQIAKLQSENGVIRKIDHAKVSVNQNNLQTQIDNLEQLYQEQISLLKYLSGIDVEREIVLTDSLQQTVEISLHETPGFANRMELKLIDTQRETTFLTQKVERESYLPSLSVIGQFYFQGQRNEFDFFKSGEEKFFKTGFIGLNLSVPLFNGLEKRYKSYQYDLSLKQLENQRKNMIHYFSKDYNDAVRQYGNSLNALQRQEENIRVAKENYDVSLQGYRHQTTSLSDLLLSESSLIEAQLSYYHALLQLKNAELDVRKAKGELLKY